MKINYGGGRKIKKISDKELVFKTAYDVIKIKNSPNGETLELTCNGAQAVLDRNQAHLLYLYLKERFEP